MRIDLIIHVATAVVGLLSGYVALFVVKGATVHRKSGVVFVYAMVAMALMGSAIAFGRNVAPGANGPVGFLTAYLVISGWTTVRPPSMHERAIERALLAVVALACITLSLFAVVTVASPTKRLYGMPAYPFIVFGIISLLATIGDVRLIRRGGVRTLRGAPRLARHLWRMSFALLIATFSLLAKAKFFPKPVRTLPILLTPPLLVLGAMLYWMWRMRFRPNTRRGPKVEWPQSGHEGIMLSHSLGAFDARKTVPDVLAGHHRGGDTATHARTRRRSASVAAKEG